MVKSPKIRLDQLVLQQAPQYSRQQIQSWIIQGKVRIEGRVETKPGTQVLPDTIIELMVQEPPFVSRAGFKLERALDAFGIDVTDLMVLDAGISTGGFTDCLLQRGAKKVYGIDVGYGQVHEKVLRDSRLQLHERTNLRTLQTVGQLVDLITLDLSFISVLKVMDAVCKLMTDQGKLIVLIKPQFEAGKHEVGKGGIVRDPAVHQAVIDALTQGIQSYGFICKGVIESPIEGATGNKEFLAYFERIKK
jgi:23S rRNA (cytidine1920-2'-O)/16S rRNA (cytidine1409-2'-O)-methyltransferase